MARAYDAAVFGASGFTGVQVCKQARKCGQFASWAVAGRSQERLQEVVDGLDGDEPKPGIIVADVRDHGSLVRMAEQVRVVMNVTGPYRFLGEPVVKACVEAGTDYIDICGEPEFMERMLLTYQEAASSQGVIVCHACAFDSIPADLGIMHSALLYKKAGGSCSGVEVFHYHEAPKGYVAHDTTLQAAVHGMAAARPLGRVRKELDDRLGPVPKSTGKLARRSGAYYFEPRLGAYALPFPGADASVVRSSRRVLANVVKDPAAANDLCPQFGVYFTLKSAKSLALLLLFGGLFQALSKFSLGRRLLLRFPRLFTCGAFSPKGPSPEQMADNRIITTFFSQGEVNGDSCSATVEIACEDPGYVGTGMMLCSTAATLLGERWALPVDGGVFTPGALFYKSGLLERLKRNGLRVEVVKSNIPS